MGVSNVRQIKMSSPRDLSIPEDKRYLLVYKVWAF